jgi:hypothetical protein
MNNKNTSTLYSQLFQAGLIVSHHDNVDWSASLDKIKNHLNSELEQLSQHDTVIAQELTSIFDQLGNKAATISAVTGLVAQRLCREGLVDYDKLEVAKVRAESYLRSHEDQFQIKRGRHGGVSRVKI